MTGNKHNKNIKNQISRPGGDRPLGGKVKNRSGQVLLIVIMLLATALTIALSTSFRSTTETQVTKLEEESQKALAAAEAGIEAALKQGTITNIGALSADLSGYSGAATCDTSYNKTYFISPLLQKDEQYTFYFADYDAGLNSFSNYWSGNLTVYFMLGSDPVALELTTIGSSGTITHYLLDPDNLIHADSGKTSVTSGNYSLNGVTFSRQSTPISLSNTKLVIARVFSSSTKIGLDGGGTILKSQGKTCDSEAVASGTNVTKKVTLFQSYPQIPAEFFVTSF
ncbi:hypothetical protein COS31_04500 [Candidatus Roizmanbacteria bacterium CG02_land_8_20_14_3_00_36_15]|uniref:Type 4 fimbrial biogenesis protein PilX N-terminal domain-containing protein n=2 Tax=Candidatus Roizmaniibacteriota TaxID=1752723 RepID=A0A2M8KK66_9BACT|nr:MAG: hypothetical protein COS51_02205 [Candidatus Roizmanbacteria bacterium CG03_land_8_20_14_0_80_36_21]PIV37430.1 MAG: hypothetical protein COS31_04500 [Candidatus Roizmanbacteria bacterium CG02_land_8_20_14_3_00_36_15]PJA52614.1 MAG: hypothetical protein CO166_04835 [Candidatus Roizmanbacteria bacterium CG_4_9_14_3_um_filter_36_11]PJC81459.1 MAG: hypothetical protein CO007_04475 [Candidatus Roizmanbacteria bacterium CG_4_8_14_3_um_filter_36_10]PJE60302.1 MAG: hypothetical protein COU86_04